MRPSIVTIVLIAILAAGLWGLAPGSRSGLGETLGVVTVGVFAGSPERQGVGPGAEKEDLGPVYMYGELLEKPYVFTNVGGDTLYLNGVPYWPIRKPVRPPTPMSEEQSRRLKELREGTETHAFADSVWKRVKAMHDSGAAYEECLEAYAQMYRASPLVRSVSKGGNSITITWANGIEEVGILDFEPSPPLPTKEEIHKGQMEDFWRNVRSGRMVARGFSQGQTYSFTAPGPDLERMDRLIERLTAGDTLSEESMIGTPFMYHPRFRMDVARRAAQRKAREE
jgi:hypothetical protein